MLTCFSWTKNTGTPILVPLTPSLYVPGKLASTDTVLVDIGTGFYVEKVGAVSVMSIYASIHTYIYIDRSTRTTSDVLYFTMLRKNTKHQKKTKGEMGRKIREYKKHPFLTQKKTMQTPSDAREFYSRKVEELGKNLVDLEKIVQGKQGNLSVVEDGESSSFIFLFDFFKPTLLLDRLRFACGVKGEGEGRRGV